MSIRFTDNPAEVTVEILRETPNKYDNTTSYTVVERSTEKFYEVVLDGDYNIQKAELSVMEPHGVNKVVSNLKKAKAKEKKALKQGLWGRLR